MDFNQATLHKDVEFKHTSPRLEFNMLSIELVNTLFLKFKISVARTCIYYDHRDEHIALYYLDKETSKWNRIDIPVNII